MNNKPNLSESLERMKELETQLKALGVPPEAIDGVMEHIDEYTELKTNLDTARQAQFHEEAYEMLRLMSACSNKNVDRLTTILRSFAEHVVEWTIHTAYPDGRNDVRTITDHIPPFYKNEEEYEED